LVKGASGIIFVYDITSKESLKNIESRWLKEIEYSGLAKLPATMLIGSKCDLESDRTVSMEEALSLASRLHASYIEVSAKENINVSEAFELMAKQIIGLEWGDGAGPRPNRIPSISILDRKAKDTVTKDKCICQ